MFTYKKFASQTAIYGLSTVLSRVLNFLLTKLYVSVYPANAYGIFTQMYSYASLMNAVMSFGMETTFFRYLSKYEDKKPQVYSNAFITIFAISILLLVFMFWADHLAMWLYRGNGGGSTLADYRLYIKCFICILVADALAVIPFAKLRADEQPLRYGIIKTVNILTFIALNLFFIVGVPALIKHFEGGFSYWIPYRKAWVGHVFIANLVASIVTLILLLPELRKLQWTYHWHIAKEMFTYSLPVFIANVSFIINENIDKIFLSRLLPPHVSDQQVGIYGACCKLAVFLSIFIQAFRLGAEPFFFSHVKEKNAGQIYARIMDHFVAMVCLIFIALSVNLQILKHFIGSPDPLQREIYWSGLGVVPVLLFGYVCLGIYMNLSIWYKLSDQTRYGLYISGVGALLTILLNGIFIPRYGYMAAAWASLVVYATMMLLSYIMGQKRYPIPYNLRKNLTYMVAAGSIVAFCFINARYNLVIGNVCFLAFLAFVIYLERKGVNKTHVL